jgi:dihydroflavonol-4-reductase
MSSAIQRRYLVTGATGFIGRSVVRALLHRGAAVRVFCRDAGKARRLFGEPPEIVVGDLCDPGSMSAACREVAVIIHIGGVYRFGRRARREMFEANVRGTEHLLAAARAAQVGRFVLASSNAVLSGGGGRLVTEQDFPERVSPREPYRWSKWLAEQAALQAFAQGLPVTIASLSSPIGAGDEVPTPTGQMVRDFLAGRFPFSAQVALNFIHVAELAEGIVAVADRGRAGERYLLGHHNVWLDDFLAVVAQCSGRRKPRCRLPQALVTAIGAVGELVGSQRVCWETAAHARQHQWLDCRKAETELGWRAAAPLEKAVSEAVEWFRRERTGASDQSTARM